MRLIRHLGLGLFLVTTTHFVACGEDAGPSRTTPDVFTGLDGGADGNPDDGTSSRDAGDDADAEPIAPNAVFAFGVDPQQTISAAPFPNDLYLSDDGKVELAPFQDDPVLSPLAKPEILARLSQAAIGREGFGYTAGVTFFIHPEAQVDLDSFEGHVLMVALGGPEAGRLVRAEIGAAPTGSALVVTPAWGEYLVPDAVYAAVITEGPTLADGRAIVRPEGLSDVLQDSSVGPERARRAFAPLRSWLANNEANIAADQVLVASVFTTEPALPLAEAVVAAARAQVSPPTLNVRWDIDANEPVAAPVIEGAQLDAYFGIPLSPFANNPGIWSSGSRQDAAQLPTQDGPYLGGSFRGRVGRVLNGSLTVPTFNFERVGDEVRPAALSFDGAGKPMSTVESMVPFTLFLCEEHLPDPSDLPVIIFSHGGGATRADALPMATLGCELGMATIAIDMVFHGGRLTTGFVPELGLIVPTGPDLVNQFTGLSEGDAGYVPDHIGDGGSAAAAVAPLFAVPQNADPGVIEANLLSITSDTANLLETLQTGDWSKVQEGLSFDPTRIFHASLSFGTSFHTALFATVDDFPALITSVGSGRILTDNLLRSPVNAAQATSVLYAVLGLQTPPQRLQTEGRRDLALQLLQWLSERGDPLSYAPYVLRYRGEGRVRPAVLSSSDSWDETLYTPAQLSFANALGLTAYASDDAWTLGTDVPGAAHHSILDFPDTPVSGNTIYQGQTFSSAIFFYHDACHAQLITPVCTKRFERPHPPATPLGAPVSMASPICALHHQAQVFLSSLLAGEEHPTVIAPSGDCASLHGPLDE